MELVLTEVDGVSIIANVFLRLTLCNIERGFNWTLAFFNPNTPRSVRPE